MDIKQTNEQKRTKLQTTNNKDHSTILRCVGSGSLSLISLTITSDLYAIRYYTEKIMIIEFY